jgi:hypothetical protein
MFKHHRLQLAAGEVNTAVIKGMDEFVDLDIGRRMVFAMSQPAHKRTFDPGPVLHELQRAQGAEQLAAKQS